MESKGECIHFKLALALAAGAGLGSLATWALKRQTNCQKKCCNESTQLGESNRIQKVLDDTSVTRIAVFCGAKIPSGKSGEEIVEATHKLGAALTSQNVELVYGGGNIGLMGEISKSVDLHGGVVHGIIPEALDNYELVGRGAQPENLQIVKTMHQRKERMARMSKAFIALPGGFGTLEELFEAITWTQLSVHRKPVGILNIGGYYDHLEKQINESVARGLISAKAREIVTFDTDPARLVQRLLAQETPEVLPLTWSKPEDVI